MADEGVTKLLPPDELETAEKESSAFASAPDEADNNMMDTSQRTESALDDSDDEMDRKPAAVDHPVESDSDSSSSESSSDEEETNPGHVDAEGRKLSEYEILRLERIKRNRMYLSELGLEGKEGGGVLGKKKSSHKPRQKPKKEVALPQRERSSRIAKEQRKSYAEPPASVRDLIGSTTVPRKNEGPKKEKKERPDRLENFIHKEFRHLKSLKNSALKSAERNLKTIGKEINYWESWIPKLERRYQRRMEALKAQEAEATERNAFGGLSTKELLQTIDSQMPRIQEAVLEYDSYWKDKNKENQREYRKSEKERKMKLLDAVERFPRAIKSATSLLNAVLVERAPKDPPPPRRSKRSSAADDEQQPETPAKKPAEQKKKKTADESPVGDEYSGVAVVPVVSSAEVEESNERSTRQGRKRSVRNVGGWISEQFSSKIDREWLAMDTPPNMFDPARYVPQVGDLVLYYITGHRRHLEQYPDVLGKKTRSKTRVPLWERAAQLKAEQEESEEKSNGQVKSWWTPEWLEGLANGRLGDYPLICRVERTHAEFPPDPWIKVVKKDENTGEAKVHFKKPKKSSDSDDPSGQRLRLAVALRPLTPLVAPCRDDSATGGSELAPLFACVTFPCEQEPFIIPFSWAYARTHALSIRHKVMVGSRGKKVEVDSFASYNEIPDMRLEGNGESIDRILAAIDSSSKNDFLDKQLSDKAMPLRDASIVIDVWRSEREKESGENRRHEDVNSCNFMRTLRSTLPLWESVPCLEGNKTKPYSPWMLLPLKRIRDLSSPWTIGSHSFVLDPHLRAKLVAFLDDFYDQSEVAQQLFYNPVTSEDAPSYFCAVPIGMSMSNIRMRLEGDCQESRRHGYYRTIDAVLSDISSILDCCLLYNDPESDLVYEASKLVKSLKDGVTKLAQEYSKEAKQALKQDEERRRVVLQHSQVVGSSESRTVRQTGSFKLRKPVRDHVNRSWVEEISRESASLIDGGPSSLDALRPFQAGDRIEYSRQHHSEFIKGHYPSLESEQCILLDTKAADGGLDSQEVASDPENVWTQGEILWTRTAFPKALSKQSGEDACTFQSNAVLQCIGAKFDTSTDVHVLFWRPCFLHSDMQPLPNTCPTCNVPTRSSFLRSSEDTSQCASPDGSALADKIDQSIQESIDDCLCLLKRRCIRMEDPQEIDSELTKENIKAGYIPQSTKVSKKSLPQFAQLFGSVTDEEKETANHNGTRGVQKKGKKDSSAVVPLQEAGFLPQWISRLRGGTVDNRLLTHLEAMLPSARVSLELVHQRIVNGYYRHEAAAQNDIIESYVTTTFMLLSESALDKKDPVSIKKVARLLNTKKDNAEGSMNFSDLEVEWARRLRYIRAVHATALVMISDTDHVERVFGLAGDPDSISRPVDLEDQDSVRVAARNKLGFIIRALGKDEILNCFAGDGKDPALPVLKVRMRCDNDDLEFNADTDFDVPAPPAVFHGQDVKVRMICEGRPIFFGNLLFKPTSEEIQPKTRKTKNGAANLKNKNIVPPLYLKFEDYEKNQEFSRRMIARPGRAIACARCKAYGRSALVCRRSRRHSNPDFDWVSEVRGGISYIIDLLKQLNPESTQADLIAKILSEQGNPAASKDSENGDAAVGADKVEKRTEPLVPDQGTDKKDDGGDTVEPEGNVQGVPDARKMIEKAHTLRGACVEIYNAAQTYANAPVRLSKEFIDSSFPIDPTDNHLVYCVVCGLSGDLLCCDGCQNVVHLSCLENAPSELPEGDWFCDECNVESKAEGEDSAATAFGRVEFDFERLELVSQELNKLREARPTPRHRKSVGAEEQRGATSQNGPPEGAEESEDDNVNDSKRKKGEAPVKRRKRHYDLETEESEEEDEIEESRSGRRRRRPKYLVERGKKRSVRMADFDEPPSPKRRRKSRGGGGRRSAADIKDPYDALSAVTREFLLSVDLTTSESFLTAKSSDLGEKLKAWRKANGMPELKGSGNVATISGWKSIVRKKAMDLKMDDLAQLEPDSRGRKSLIRNDSEESDEEEEEEKPPKRGRRRRRRAQHAESDSDGPTSSRKGRTRERRRGTEEYVSESRATTPGRRSKRSRHDKDTDELSQDGSTGLHSETFDPVAALASEASPAVRRSRRSRKPRKQGDLVEDLVILKKK